MKKFRIAHTALALASLLLLTACSQNDGADADVLPGKHPMTFTTTVEGLAVTRAATANGAWTIGDAIAVKVGSDVKQYAVTSIDGGQSATLQIANNATPFYWSSTADITASAWYCGTGYSATLPATWSVQSNQSQDEEYQKSDFLYASPTAIAYNGSKSLKFYHQTAKVIINLRFAETGNDASSIQSVSINNVTLGGNFSAPVSDSNYGLKVTSTTNASITPKQLATANTNVNFGNSIITNAIASYEALVIPQTVAATTNFISITLKNGTTYYYKAVDGHNQLQAGKAHAYNITVKKTGLEVTAGITGWTGGTGGAGISGEWYPVYTPTNNPANYTLSDGEKIMVAGDGTQTSGSITIQLPGEGKSATIVLSNVNINNGSTPLVIAGGGTATILLNGTQNTLICTDANCGLQISGAKTNVIIKGPGALTAVGKNGGAAIGSFWPDYDCGDITIQDAVINATSQCGVNYAGAAIGAGDPTLSSASSVCGNITIIRSDITASTETDQNRPTGAAIGTGPYNSSCGDINITLKEGQTKEQFLDKLTVGNAPVKVGNAGSGNCGTITWSLNEM